MEGMIRAHEKTAEPFKHGGDLDTAYKLRFYGPCDDGDLPSKTSAAWFREQGFAEHDEKHRTRLTSKGRRHLMHPRYIWMIKRRVSYLLTNRKPKA